MTEINNEALLKLAISIQELYNNQKGTNLLDTVYVNENVHSRILRLILEFSHKGDYPFLKSFVGIDKVASILPEQFNIAKPVFYNERDRIDLLIEDENYGYAIIIENKIYNAEDQERQIERYLKSCRERGFRTDNLYALYLTSDGTKKVAEWSLTEEARSILGISTSSSGRYVAISFRYDILPWLKRLVLSSDESFRQINAAILQYTDYLSGMFGEREMQAKNNKIIMDLLKENGIGASVASFSRYIEAVGTLSEELCSKRDGLCIEYVEKYISAPLEDYCKAKNRKLSMLYSAFNGISLRISLPGLLKASFCFNTEGDGQNIYGIGNHNVNDGEDLGEEVLLRFNKCAFRRSPWWPAYTFFRSKYQKFHRTATVAFWDEVIHQYSFAEFVIEAYQEVEAILLGKGEDVK